jgi:DNA-binding CsgD family transcriptional regulator/catechol 2,3-dioxygenase-like lactoylglutathione lyase family enzyme
MASQNKRGRPPHSDVLTPVEWQVVNAVRHGLSNRQIAALRGTSLDAVKYHVANALAKLELADRRALRQWTGVARHSNLHSAGTTMAQSEALGAIGQIARTVNNIDAARRWYGEVLGLKHLYSFGDLAFFDCGGVRLFLSLAKDGQESSSIFYFRVADIRSAHADLSARGVQFVSAPHMIHRHDDGTEEWMAFFEDNECRPLAIMAQVKP